MSNFSYGILSFDDSFIRGNNGAFSLGIVFKVAVEKKIIGLRIFSKFFSGDVVMRLWDKNGNNIATANAQRSPDQWGECYFDNPITLSPNEEYRASYYSGKNEYELLDIKKVVAGDDFIIVGGCETSGDKYPETVDSYFWGVDVIFSDNSDNNEPEEPDEPEYLTKYLLKSEDVICTVIDGELVLLDQTELTAEVFQSHGFDELPAWDVISTLTNPEILYWQSADIEDELPTITATMTATPYPQTIISPNYNMTDDTILGVECAYVTASSDVVFAISVDDGVTWYMWTGQAWGILTDTATGMSAETINAITTEQWAGLMTTGQFKVRMTLFDENSSFTSFVMDYIN